MSISIATEAGIHSEMNAVVHRNSNDHTADTRSKSVLAVNCIFDWY